MKNIEIAKIFYEIADILEMKNVQWKPRAYRKAAKALESLSEDVEVIYKKGGIKALEEIPGVGQRLAKKIIEYIETGKIKEHQRLTKKIPKGLDELMEVMGLGPKKVMVLYKKLGIKNIKDLEKAVKKHKLKNVFRFGEKTEENILKGLEVFKRGKQRILLGLALPTANNIIKQLKILKEIHKIEYAGSLRRMQETIGDIDILVTASNPEPVMNLFTKLPDVARVFAKGKTKSSVLLKNGMQADVRVVEDASFGSAMQYFTGNKEHNIRLREIAIKKGLKLSEYGLFNKKTNKKVAGKTEEEVYKKLNMPYIEPELRENRGEIEAAKKKMLPKLINYNDINGDFHIHSKWSDGSETIENLARNAMKLGYQYICITDHSKTRAIAHGLSEESLLKQINEISKLNRKFRKFRIFSSSEVDILLDGSLDYDESILKKLDIVTVAVHSGFKLSKRQTTERIIKALENKYVKILEHPTGRIINKREPYEVDIEQIFAVAKEKKKFLEINSMPDRLDLNDVLVKKAKEQGIKLVIGTDAHSLDHLRFMKLGVAVARRGWCEKKDILNTYPLEKVIKILNI